MGVERYTFDTNVLFYSIDSSDPQRHQLARRLVGLADPSRTPILLQTLGELCNSVAKRRSELLPQAREVVSAANDFYEVLGSNLTDIQDGMDIHVRHHLQFWDAVIWATARRNGCTVLLTEDLQDGRTIHGVTFRNPFVMSEEDLRSFL